MKHKGAVLFGIDVMAALLLAGLLATGAILEWVLPHGQGPGSGHHRARDAEFLMIARHDWGEVHFWVSIAFVATIALHLLLHSGWIKASVAKYVLRRSPRRRASRVGMAS